MRALVGTSSYAGSHHTGASHIVAEAVAPFTARKAHAVVVRAAATLACVGTGAVAVCARSPTSGTATSVAALTGRVPTSFRTAGSTTSGRVAATSRPLRASATRATSTGARRAAAVAPAGQTGSPATIPTAAVRIAARFLFVPASGSEASAD